MSNPRVPSEVRKTQCAASPGDDSWTPEERACWHIKRINKLLAMLREKQRKYEHYYRLAATQRRTINGQRIALANKDSEIVRLQSKLRDMGDANTTPAPEYKGDPNS